MPTTNTKPSRHALRLLAALLPLLLLLIVAGAAAQPNDWRDDRNRSDDDDGGRMSPGARARQQPPPSFSAPMVVLLVALIAVFFFIGFFSIYIRQCGRGGAASSGLAIPAAALLALSRQEQQQNQQRNGLDPALVASFPTMTYAEARALRVRDEGKGKGDDAMAVLECAVCLSEFDDDEELRLLPKCSHAFHPDCIGEWLAGHVTCPVCRCSLKPEEDKEDEPAAAAAAEANGSSEQQQDQVAIDMNGEEEEERRREEEEATELDRIGSQRRAMRSRSGRSISRAHSTGHSLSLSARRPRLDCGDLERFTLRLPEQVRREMEAESMRRAVLARDDGSSRAARSARIGRSDRWQQQQSFIARTFSSSRVPFWGAAASRRAPPDAEAGAGGVLPAGSTTTTTPAATTTGQGRTVREKTADGSVSSAKLGSVRFDCLGGGGAVAADDSENEAEEEKAIVRRV